VLRHKIDHPAQIEVDNQAMLASITIPVDGPDETRTLITIRSQPEITG
jgi:hypothetical protein